MKAANVLLTGSRRVCIADFGLSEAKDRSKSMTRSAQGSGSSGGGMTVAWSAPELLNGEPKSFATDVFALGVTLWETFMRATPYKGMPDVVRRLRGGPSCLGPSPPPFAVRRAVARVCRPTPFALCAKPFDL